MNIPQETTHVRFDSPDGKNSSTVGIADIAVLGNHGGRITLMKKVDGKFTVIDTVFATNAADQTTWAKKVAAPTPAPAPAAVTKPAPPPAPAAPEKVEEKPAIEVQAETTVQPEAMPEVAAAAPEKKPKAAKATKAAKPAKTAKAVKTKPADKKTKRALIRKLGNGKLTADEIAVELVKAFPEKGTHEAQLAKAKRYVYANTWHAKKDGVKFSYASARQKKKAAAKAKK